jgi:TRAP-type C4-dicarboxylate transport system substrate-binding protein
MFRLMNTLLLFLSLLSPLSQAGTTLKIATLAPDGTNWMKEMRAAAEQINQQTDDRVKLHFYPGGVMGNDNSVLRKIRVGQLQGGAITGGSLSIVYKDAQVYSLPFQFRNLQEVDAVRQIMDPQIIQGLKEQGYISFGLSEGGFAYLLSNSPVTSTQDMKDLKIWIPEGDEVNAMMFQTLGISPVPLPLSDVLTGLQTGLIDTIASSAAGAIALQWHTRVSYLTQTPLAYLYATLVLKDDAFNKLQESDQTIVKRILESTFDRIGQQNRQDNEQALAALKKQGIEFISPTAAQQKAWESHANDMLEKLSSEKLFSKDMLDKMQSLIEQQRQQQAAITQ